MSKLKVTTLFSGIGAQEAGLKRLGVDFEMVGMCEIDKSAIKSYEGINGPTRNYGDISKIDRLDYADLLVYSSPCQDFSLSGRQAGLIDTDGKQTRSGLLLEVGRLLMKMSDEGILPKYLLMENVKNLVGKKFKPAFDIWLKALEAIGYNNYWKVLNAKDYGVPQNRERVFVVSIRKDVDTRGYTFPEPFKLNRRLKDVLETNVNEKYYLKQDLVETFIKRLAKREVSNTIRCGGAGSIDQKHTRDLVAEPSIVQNPHGYNNDGIIKGNVAPTMTSNGSYHLNNFVCNEPLTAASRGRYPDNPSSGEAGLPTVQMLEINESGCSNTLTTVGKDNLVVEPKINVLGNYKPSGHECGRVMGVEGVSPTIKDNHGAVYSIAEPQIKLVGNAYYPDKDYGSGYAGATYDSSGIAATLTTMGGGNREPCVGEPINACAEVSSVLTTAQKDNMSCEPKGRFFQQAIETFKQNECNAGDTVDAFHKQINSSGCSPTLTTRPEGFKTAVLCVVNQENNTTEQTSTQDIKSSLRIRKLTPKECWRLMDFTDEEFEAAQNAGVSKTQLYKQAGNSIVISCLAHIFRELLKDTEYEPEEGFKTDWLERLKGADNA